LGIRFLLRLLAANPGNGFADFVYTVTHPFVAPFFGLFNYREQFGASRFEFETLIAILVYALVIAVLARLATLSSRRTDA
jgi:YggT family protein